MSAGIYESQELNLETSIPKGGVAGSLRFGKTVIKRVFLKSFYDFWDILFVLCILKNQSKNFIDKIQYSH